MAELEFLTGYMSARQFFTRRNSLGRKFQEKGYGNIVEKFFKIMLFELSTKHKESSVSHWNAFICQQSKT